MNPGSSLNKRKRTSSSDSNSIFQKVQNEVTKLLPNKIISWFKNDKQEKSSGNGLKSQADTDSSTDDEISFDFMEPPYKRKRFVSNELDTENHMDSEPISYVQKIENVKESAYVKVFRRENIIPSSSIAAQHRAEGSTSASTFTETRLTTTKTKRQTHTATHLDESISQMEDSLFGKKSKDNKEALIKACVNTSINKSKDQKQPYFKPSLLGSPFYPGQTMYGGASNNSYLSKPNVGLERNVVINKESNSRDCMSQSVRSVLDLLEQFSSPVADARRMELCTKQGTGKNSTINETVEKSKCYKTRELRVFSKAKLLRIKKQNQLRVSTALSRQILASHSSTSDQSNSCSIQPGPRPPLKYNSTLKIKSRLTRPKQGEDPETEMLHPINLPNNSIKIDSGKPIRLESSFSNTANQTRLGVEKATCVAEINIKSASKTNSDNKAFEFSSPSRISNNNKLSQTPATGRFTFNFPDKCVDRKKDNVSSFVGASQAENTFSSAMPESVKEKFVSYEELKTNEPVQTSNCVTCNVAITNAQSNQCADREKAQTLYRLAISKDAATKWNCNDCLVSNENDVDVCVCCGGKKPRNVNSVSKVPPNNTATEWTCEKCCIKNESNMVKCKSCESTKPGPNAKATVASKSFISTGSTSNQFQFGIINTNSNSLESLKPFVHNSQSSGDWRCTVCLIMNKGDAVKCLACKGPRVDSKRNKPETITSVTKNTDANTSKNKFNEWNCSTCLVCNDGKSQKCYCCGTDKPGSQRDINKGLFNFSANPNPSNKFIMETDSLSEPTKISEVVEVASNKVDMENNNILPKAPSPNYSATVMPSESIDCPDNVKPKQKDTLQLSEALVRVTPNDKFDNPQFSFGSSYKNSPPKSTSIKDIADKENEQEVPTVSSKTENTSLFAPIQTNQTQSTSPLISSVSKENEMPSKTFAVVPTPTSKEAQQASKQVGEITTTITPSSNTFTPIHIPASNSSLIVPETALTPTTTSFFYFCATQSSSQSQIEKPKFNFSFGNMNKDAGTSLFNVKYNTDKIENPASVPATHSLTSNTCPKKNLFGSLTPSAPTNTIFSANDTTNLQKSGIFSFGSSNFTAGPVPPFGTVPTSAYGTTSTTFNTNTVTQAPIFPDSSCSSKSTTQPSAFVSNPSTSSVNFGSRPQPVRFGSTQTLSFCQNPVLQSTPFGSNLPSQNSTYVSNPIPQSTSFRSNEPPQPPFGSYSAAQPPSVFGLNQGTQVMTYGPNPTTHILNFDNANSNNVYRPEQNSIFGMPNQSNSLEKSPTPLFSSAGNVANHFGASENFRATATAPFGNAAPAAPQPFGNPASVTSQPFGNAAPAAPQPFGNPASVTSQPFGNAAPAAPQPFGNPASVTSQPFENAAPAAPQPFGNPASVTSQPFGNAAAAAPQPFGNPASVTSQPFGNAAPAAPQPFGNAAPAASNLENPTHPFNFGASQSTSIFGFGQQSQPTSGVYNFGRPAASAPVQFNIGSGAPAPSASNMPPRKFRKATRRAPPR